jgi:hypothetical protein
VVTAIFFIVKVGELAIVVSPEVVMPLFLKTVVGADALLAVSGVALPLFLFALLFTARRCRLIRRGALAVALLALVIRAPHFAFQKILVADFLVGLHQGVRQWSNGGLFGRFHDKLLNNPGAWAPRMFRLT